MEVKTCNVSMFGMNIHEHHYLVEIRGFQVNIIGPGDGTMTIASNWGVAWCNVQTN
jgi:hypothetical protein